MTLTCRFCASPLRLTLVDLGMSPLSNTYLTESQLGSAERFYPLHVRVCESCWLAQLPSVVAASDIFSDYAYFSSYSDSWLAHAKAYVASVVARFGFDKSSQVIEVASNDGYLLQYFQERGVPVLGVEPAANVAKVAVGKGIATRVEFFGARVGAALAAELGGADLVLGNNVLAHVPDINDFIAGLAAVLKPSGIVTMEFPHLQRLMAGNQFDTIYHEHYSYLSVATVGRMFAAHGLTLFDVEEIPTHGGSLRIYAKLASDSRPVLPSVAALAAREREFGLEHSEAYERFAVQVHATKRRLLRYLIEAKEAGRRVFGYGAPAKGNTLLNYCGVRSDLLELTVDRSPHKQGHYLPGTRIPVHSPEAIREHKPDDVLILPWNIKDEVMAQMSDVFSWGGRFVVAIPRVEVYEGPA